MTKQQYSRSLPYVMRTATFAVVLFTYSTANAQYVATGPYKGTVCSGFIIESCGTHEIAAVKGKDGKLYTLQTQHEAVDEYNEDRKRCHIRTKSKGAGWVSLGLNAIAQPVFLSRQPNGEYKELDVEYVSFPCVKK